MGEPKAPPGMQTRIIEQTIGMAVMQEPRVSGRVPMRHSKAFAFLQWLESRGDFVPANIFILLLGRVIGPVVVLARGRCLQNLQKPLKHTYKTYVNSIEDLKYIYRNQLNDYGRPSIEIN